MKIKLPSLALAALFFAGLPLASSNAYVGISVGIAPPAIPIYEQPYCPTPGYIWTPGYWDYADFGYYWVPGVWVAPPRVGVLWTPGYWGYRGGHYFFNEGYWGPRVGYYGGINYGFGYGGRGYYGGEWSGNNFRYNTAVTRVNTTIIHNTYINREVVRKNTIGSRAGFNGPGGAQAKATAAEQAAAKGEHVAPTSAQRSRAEAAKADPGLHAANNKGKPKAEAVNAFHRNNGEQLAKESAPNPSRAGAEKQNRAANQARAEKAPAKAAKAPERSTAKARRAGDGSVMPARRAAQARRTARAADAPRAAQRAQTVRPRPQGARVPQAAPAARGRGPAQAPQNSKKKKRQQDQPPGGQ